MSSAGSAGSAGAAGSSGTVGTGGPPALEPGVGGASNIPTRPEAPLPPARIGTPPALRDVEGGGTAPSGDGPGFEDQMVWNMAPAHRVLYSWTTAEQAAELRRDRVLLTRTERPGLGPGYAFAAIEALASTGTSAAHRLLALFGKQLFVKARYAWPHPWATRMGWPGEDYGDELIRIVLKPEAWIVVVADERGMSVIDSENRVVSAEEALAHPERIGAIYFYRTTVDGRGTFQSCSGGYREFIVGNEAMIEEWSIGTDEIRARIEEDAQRFDRLIESARSCSDCALDATTFNVVVACRWDDPATADPISMYYRSVAIPSAHYVPRPAEIGAVAEALRAALFEPSPLIVVPGGP